MIDRRLFASNGRFAHTSLKDQVSGVSFTDGENHTVVSPIANILSSPNGTLERQLLFGDAFTVLEWNSGENYAFGMTNDGPYVGYVAHSDLAPHLNATHMVASLGAHIYGEPDIKTIHTLTLPYGAALAVATYDSFCELESGGFVPQQQVGEFPANALDFVQVAERFLSVPYLWGGDSHFGLDCSGLVHLAQRGCGNTCPRDSDLQAAMGSAIPDSGTLQRGDLIFWRGHVGIMQSESQILHANGHHMSVTSEDFGLVCERIFQSGNGPVTHRRRL